MSRDHRCRLTLSCDSRARTLLPPPASDLRKAGLRDEVPAAIYHPTLDSPLHARVHEPVQRVVTKCATRLAEPASPLLQALSTQLVQQAPGMRNAARAEELVLAIVLPVYWCAQPVSRRARTEVMQLPNGRPLRQYLVMRLPVVRDARA